jgi:hypothetical protein
MMKKHKWYVWGSLAGLLVCILAGCELTNDNGATRESAIPLRLNTWADGELAADGERWYQFTATAQAQYIHIVRGTVDTLYVQLHDGAGNEIGEPYAHTPYSGTYKKLDLTSGKTYYLKLSSPAGGAYKIAFTELAEVTPDTAAAMASATTLSADTWVSGELTRGGEHWYRFTATAETQYIHIVRGTVSSLYVEARNDAGKPLGTYTYSPYLPAYNSLLLTSGRGRVYYLKVWTEDSGSRPYKIAFNTSADAPSD